MGLSRTCDFHGCPFGPALVESEHSLPEDWVSLQSDDSSKRHVMHIMCAVNFLMDLGHTKREPLKSKRDFLKKRILDNKTSDGFGRADQPSTEKAREAAIKRDKTWLFDIGKRLAQLDFPSVYVGMTKQEDEAVEYE